MPFRDRRMEDSWPSWGGTVPGVAKAVFGDLAAYLRRPIGTIAESYWQHQAHEDRLAQQRVGAARDEAPVLAYYATTPHYLYELSYWEASVDKQMWFRVVALACRRHRLRRVLDFGGGVGGLSLSLSARLEFPGEACAWLHVGRLAPQKRRRVCVLTETRLYVWDDMSPDKLTVSSVAFTRRYVEGMPEPLDAAVLGTSSELPTMVHVLSCFLDGLAGGDTSRFGAGLAHDVTCVLAACEDALRRTRGPWHAVS